MAKNGIRTLLFGVLVALASIFASATSYARSASAGEDGYALGPLNSATLGVVTDGDNPEGDEAALVGGIVCVPYKEFKSNLVETHYTTRSYFLWVNPATRYEIYVDPQRHFREFMITPRSRSASCAREVSVPSDADLTFEGVEALPVDIAVTPASFSDTSVDLGQDHHGNQTDQMTKVDLEISAQDLVTYSKKSLWPK